MDPITGGIMAASALGSLFGGGRSSGSSAEKALAYKQTEMANAQLKTYDQYMPYGMGELSRAYQGSPAWMEALRTSGAQRSQLAMQSNLGNILGTLQRRGLGNSGLTGDLTAVAMRGNAQNQAQNDLQIAQMGDARQLGLLQALIGNASGQGAAGSQALAQAQNSFGQIAARSSAQDAQTWQGIGALLGYMLAGKKQTTVGAGTWDDWNNTQSTMGTGGFAGIINKE